MQVHDRLFYNNKKKKKLAKQSSNPRLSVYKRITIFNKVDIFSYKSWPKVE